MAPKLNVAIYVRDLEPDSPASARFQDSLLSGVEQITSEKFHFYVFSGEIAKRYKNTANITYVRLAQYSRRWSRIRRCKLLVGGASRRILRLIGATSSRLYHTLGEWLAYEPAYYAQMRALDIRLVWNLGIDILPTPLPFIMVVWDCNYRIHPMFPEYSTVEASYGWHDRNTPFLQTASYALVGTEQGKREVIEIFSPYPEKIRVVPFPTPVLPKAGEQSTVRQRPAYVFYPARFWPHKNHVVLLHALKLLRERWNIVLNCVFSGIDNGNLNYVMRLAQELGVREQIEYLGNVSLDELADLYRNAAALVYCSAVGPDNFPPLEAMSVGCPVITADVPGAREQYGDAAMFFKSTDDEELAECIRRLLEDQELRRTLIENGLQRAGRWIPLDYANSIVGLLEEFALIARMWDSNFKANLV